MKENKHTHVHAKREENSHFIDRGKSFHVDIIAATFFLIHREATQRHKHSDIQKVIIWKYKT